MSTVPRSGRRKVTIKAVAGFGRRRDQWAEPLYDILFEEFSRYKATGVKFSTPLLATIARDIILTSKKFAVKFGPTYVDPADDIKVKTRWVQQFMVCGVTLEDNYEYSDKLNLH